MSRFRALAALVSRNLRIALRRPDLLVQTMAVPVVVFGLATIIFGAGDAWPVAVVDRASSPESQRFIQSLTHTAGATGPYFKVVENQPGAAAELVETGRLQLVITIPPDFDQSHTIETTTYNINTDAMKNVRLRLATTANLFDEETSAAQLDVIINKAKPNDVTRSAFMGGSAVMLALLLGAALISANLFALETEHRTTKEIALSPMGSYLAGPGAAVAGWALAFVAAIPTLTVALAFGTRAGARQILLAGLILLPAGLAAAGVGVWVAARLRTHRLIQPTLILLALGSYFASGGFISVSALPPLARSINVWWPPSYVFEWANPVLHDFRSAPSPGAIGILVCAAAAGLALAAMAARRQYRQPQLQGQ